MPADMTSPLGGIVSYFRFLASEPPAMAGMTSFETLSSEDLFLAACYYDSGPAAKALNSHREWNYVFVNEASLTCPPKVGPAEMRGLV